MKKNFKYIFLILVLIIATYLHLPLFNISFEREQSKKLERLLQEADAEVGLPNISNFTEKKLVKLLLELRDQNISTYSYVSDGQGLHFVCNSLGFGLPYATQYVNPINPLNFFLPQAEPNSLFMPSSAEASWIICSDSKKNLAPVYVEDKIISSPFKLKAVDSWNLNKSPEYKTNLKLK